MKRSHLLLIWLNLIAVFMLVALFIPEDDELSINSEETTLAQVYSSQDSQVGMSGASIVTATKKEAEPVIPVLQPSSPVLQEDSFSLPIVLYHSVQDRVLPNESNPYVISATELRSDLTYIKAKGYNPVHMNEIIDYVYFGGTLPENPILLTFDDGYEDNYTVAFPILQEFDMKAVVCLITSHFDGNDSDAYPHLTAEQVQEMQKSELIEFQCHTYDFHFSNGRNGSLPLSSETPEQYEENFRNDLAASREVFRNINLFYSTTFSYPGGLVTPVNSQLVEDAGFVATFVTYPMEANIITRDDPSSLLNLTRFNRDRGVSSSTYFIQLEAFAFGG